MEVNGQLHTSATLTMGARPLQTHCIRGWVGPRASLDSMEKKNLLLLSELNLSCPAHSLVPIPTELSQLLLNYVPSSYILLKELFLLINGASVGLYRWLEFKYPALKVFRKLWKNPASPRSVQGLRKYTRTTFKIQRRQEIDRTCKYHLHGYASYVKMTTRFNWKQQLELRKTFKII
jgi:hypothetical protein